MTLDTGNDAQPSMFTSAYSSNRLTDKGMSLVTVGLTMPNQSNGHDSDNNELFCTPPTMMKRLLDIIEYKLVDV